MEDIESGLHCPITYCKVPVNRKVHQANLTEADKAAIAESEMCCENEGIRHYTNGILVKIPYKEHYFNTHV